MDPKVSVAGGVLTIVGGFLILLVGAVVSYLLNKLLTGFSIGNTALGTFLVLGPVLGVVIIIVGVLAMVAPSLKILWGALAIVLSIVSIFTSAVGGAILGFILALIGGILILVKTAPPPAPMAYQMGVPPPQS